MDDGHFSLNTLTPNRSTTLTAALRYAELGWPVIPIHPDTKRPLIKWGTGASTNLAQIHTWFTQWPEANVAIRTGVGAALAVVDIDSPEGWKSLQRAAVAAGEALPTTRTIRTARGAHLYFRLDGPLRSQKREGLELKADKTYVLAPPSRHPSGAIYTVLCDAPLADLPQFIIELFQAHGATATNHDTQRETHPGNPTPVYLCGLPRHTHVAEFLQNFHRFTADPEEIERIKSALQAIPASIDRDAWVRVGMILKDCQLLGEGGSDAGLELWDTWSATAPEKYPGEAQVAYQWNSFRGRPPGEGVTSASLFALAHEHGWGMVKNTGHDTVNGTPADHLLFQPDTNRDVSMSEDRHAIVFDATDFSHAAPPRRWFVNGWIPADQACLIAGDGGVGKSTLILQLAVAAITSTPWFGLPVTSTNILYVSAEDDRDELHWRFQEIAKHTPLTAAQRHRLKFFDLTQSDPVLVVFDKRNGKLSKQPIFERIEAYARDNDVHCIILDAAADVFGGSEIDRTQVRAFLASLRAMAQRLDSAVILISHPSVSGMKDDRGYSGSTAWNATVRSRLWFKKYDTVPESPETDLRVLELRKANRAEAEIKIVMRWHEGRFVTTSTEMAQSEVSMRAEDDKFLALLALATKQGIKVSPKDRAKNYAPSILSKYPSAKGYNKAALERSMYRLLENEVIVAELYGPPSSQHQSITLKQ